MSRSALPVVLTLLALAASIAVALSVEGTRAQFYAVVDGEISVSIASPTPTPTPTVTPEPTATYTPEVSAVADEAQGEKSGAGEGGEAGR